MLLKSKNHKIDRTHLRLRRSFIESLEERAVMSCDLFSISSPQLKSQLADLQAVIDKAVNLGDDIPVLGSNIKDTGKIVDQFAMQLSDKMASFPQNATEADIKAGLISVLHAAPLDILSDRNNDGQYDGDDIDATFGNNNGVCTLTIGMGLSHDLAKVGLGLGSGFTFSIKSLPFHVGNTGGVEAEASFDWPDFRFTLDSNGGAAFDLSSTSDLSLNIKAGLIPGTELAADLGIFHAHLTDGVDLTVNGNPVHQTTQLQVGILADLGIAPDGSFTVDPDVVATADVDLHVSADASTAFPSIGADFVMHWDGTDPAAPAPTVDFKNVTLELGNYISGILSPLVNVINKATAPIKPVINLATTPLPVLSDLGNAVGLGDISLLSLADLGDDFMPSTGFQELIDVAKVFVQVLEIIDQLDSTGSHLGVNLGDVSLNGDNDNDGIADNGDLRNQPAAKNLQDNLNETNLTTLVISPTAVSTIKNALDNSDLPQPLKDLVNDVLHRFTNGISYDFPFLTDPLASIGNWFVGRDTTIFKFIANAQFDAAADFSSPLGFGVDAVVDGLYHMDAHVEIGMDTFGLRKFLFRGIKNNGAFNGPDLLDGLYISNDSHIFLDGGFSAGVAADAVVFEAEVSGGISGGLHLNMPDPNELKSEVGFSDNDPFKIRPFSELKDCLFDASGVLSFGLHTKIRLGTDAVGASIETNIGPANLFKFDTDCIPNPFIQDAPQLASIDENGVLTLFVGSNGPLRTGYEVGQDAEKYVLNVGLVHPDDIVPLPQGDVIDISAFGMYQHFVGVKKIVANAGAGYDTIQILASDDPVGHPLTADVTINGEDGNDDLTYQGTGVALMHGGQGDDYLTGGDGDNQLFGDSGNDLLQGGAGTNLLNGGDGNDVLRGGVGTNRMGAVTFQNDLLTEDGDDSLSATTGQNLMRGGAGNDSLSAGPLEDDLDGGAGDDHLKAGKGSAKLVGNRGNDFIAWQVGDGIPLLIDGGSNLESNTLCLGGSSAADVLGLSKDPSTPSLKIAGLSASAFLAAHMQNIAFEGLEGSDSILVAPLTNTSVKQVGLNLGDVLKSQMSVGDGAVDHVIVQGTNAADNVQIEKEVALIKLTSPHTAPTYGGIMKVTGIPSYSVRLANVGDDLLVNSVGGNDNITISSMTGPTRIQTGQGDDKVNVLAKSPGVPNDPANTPDYTDQLSINEGAGTNRLVVDQSASTIGLTTTVKSDLITSELLPGVHYVATGGNFGGGVSVSTGGMVDNVNIVSTLAAITTSIDTHAGGDVIRVGSNAPALDGNLLNIRGPLTIEAGQGENALILTDRTALVGNTNVTVSPNAVLGFAGPSDNSPVTFTATQGNLNLGLQGSESLNESFQLISPEAITTVVGNGGNDSIKIASLKYLAAVSGGIGNDTIEVGTNFNSLDNVLASVLVFGSDGFDKLNIIDSQAALGHSYSLTSNQLNRQGGTSIQFDPTLESLNFVGTNHDDQMQIVSLPSSPTTASVSGGLNGADKILGPNTVNSWNIISNNAGTLNNQVVFSHFASITGGSQADTFLPSQGVGVDGIIEGGLGTDKLSFAAYTSAVTIDVQNQTATHVGHWASIEELQGGQASDLFIGPNLPNGWQIQGADSGRISTMQFGNLSFQAFENLRGGTSTDNFQLAPTGSLTGAITDLGGLNDRLDYSLLSTSIEVNLFAAVASRVGLGVSGVENVTGGSGNDVITGNDSDNNIQGGGGNDILVGRSGNDTLSGGSGRDLLIGGLGSDSLDGGSDEDIVIGNRSTHENNVTSLRAILAEWTRLNVTYLDRISHLRLGGGLNGNVRLNVASVLDDAAVDSLLGSTDTNDWFWATLAGPNKDNLLDLLAGEVVN